MDRVKSLIDKMQIDAATFDEILSDQYGDVVGQKANAEKAADRLAAWCKSATSGDWGQFSKRLAEDKLSYEKALQRFSDAKVNASSMRSDYRWVINVLAEDNKKDDRAMLFGESEELPFEHFFHNLISEAVRERDAKLSDTAALRHFNNKAMACFNSMLLKGLVDISHPLFYVFFDSFREGRHSSQKLPTGTQGNLIYQDFIKEFKQNLLVDVFSAYPVMLRLINLMVEQWIETTGEFIQRLNIDHLELMSLFTEKTKLGQVVDIEYGISDLHNKGRSVYILTFGNGEKLVYKPRCLDLEKNWNDMVEELNTLSPPYALRGMRVISRKDYGWAEYIQHINCNKDQDIYLFFKRAGSLLALLYLFCATDMHEENIIASGSHPIPIDLETILHFSITRKEKTPAILRSLEKAGRKIANSVLTVGLLPSLFQSVNTAISAAGGINLRAAEGEEGWYANINRDDMQKSFRAVDLTVMTNLPKLREDFISPHAYMGFFLEGFSAYSDFLLKKKVKQQLLSRLQKFKNLNIRVVIRPTHFYSVLMTRLKDPENMKDGVTWSAHGDFVARFVNWDDDKQPFRGLQKAERESLLMLNVPYLFGNTSNGIVGDKYGCSVRLKTTNGIDRAAVRIRKYDKEEAAWQAHVARLCFMSSGPIEQSWVDPVQAGADKDVLDKTEILAVSERIADLIIDNALEDKKSIAWLALSWRGYFENSQFATMGSDIYSGMAGLALFFAGLCRVTRKARYRDYAMKSLSLIIHAIDNDHAGRAYRTQGVGAAFGIGSFIYALTVCAKLLDEPSLLSAAQKASEAFNVDLINADKYLDIVHGSAGGILALAKLYQATPSDGLLAKLTACADHIVANSDLDANGHITWQAQHGQNLAGFSHGASGMAHALRKASLLQANNTYAPTIDALVRYEDSHYDAQHANWADMRGGVNDKSYLACQWCHGAGGIGLARLALLKSNAKNDLLLSDLQKSLQAIETRWPMQSDSLCCGNLGNIELLFEAGAYLKDERLTKLAITRLNKLVALYQQSGNLNFLVNSVEHNLGMFQGISGFGYTLLRRLDPAIPNVLVWD